MKKNHPIQRGLRRWKILPGTNHNYFLEVLFVFIIALSCNQKNNLPDPLEAGWKNQPVCELLEESQDLRILKCSFPPGVGHEKHYHNAYFGYTISGSRMRITDSKGTREVDVPTGSNFSNDGVVCHEVLNIGDSTAIFLIIEPK